MRCHIIVLGTGMLIVLIIAAAGIRVLWNRHTENERSEAARKVISEGYEAFVRESEGQVEEGADVQEVTEETAGEGDRFALWISEKYPEEMKAGLAAVTDDGNFSSQEAYDVLGATLHVLRDDFLGYLKNESFAAERGIYIKSKDAQGGKENASISIAGDLCLEEDGFVIDKYDEVNDLESCISPEILDITRGADLFYLNHEYTVSKRGEALAGKLYTFRAGPDRMKILEDMGTDLVSLANNHIYDYGEEAMLDTMMYLDEAEIPYVGGGKNIEEASRPVYFVINGIKIGFVAASNAELTLYTPAATETKPGILEAYDTSVYNEIIAETAKECDYLIAYIHWGPEDVNQYAQYQTEQGKEFLNAGADIVVGGHPHVLQGIEYMDGKPVIYSMGDFWFNGETKYTGVLNLEISPAGELNEMTFTPCLQTGYTTQYIEDEKEQREMYDFLESLSPNIVISDDGRITESQ